MMKEIDKMLSGDIYNTRDPELMELAFRAKKLIETFNNTSVDETEEKERILKKLIGNMGEGVWIEKPFFCDFGKNISIGRNTFINYNCVFLDNNKITIGENVLIAPNVQIYTASHPIKVSERINTNPQQNEAPYRTYTKPVKIGNNVWIGGNSVILPGVSIGNHTVIGAGSVVTKSIPDNCVAAGNPCKVIKRDIN
ncbi:sugar O-acetyltransferase [Fictibacillus sp. UD]|uniref:sugar O-acetyltransferase n=1 Tax=Fictibacillus sp. UD TaxID=3038777 RepID=UPI003746BF11